MIDQATLNYFYQTLKITYPRTAELMHTDIQTVAIFARGQDKTPANEAVDRLRMTARDLPEMHKRVLESALTELGYGS